MAVRYTDEEIDRMIAEQKPLPSNYRSRFKLRAKSGHKGSELDVTGVNHSKFSLILRQSNYNPLDFSVILAVSPPDSHELFRLCRYNGKHGEHTNQIEGETFIDFHIHKATERYQERGANEDSFAEPTNRYADYDSALGCMLEDCCFVFCKDADRPLFKGVDT